MPQRTYCLNQDARLLGSRGPSSLNGDRRSMRDLTIYVYTSILHYTQRRRMAIDLSECPDCLCWASRRAARKITRASDRHLRPHGVRITQFTVLVMLMLAGPLTIGELAHKLSIERTTLSRNLALMEAAAWITTRPGDDARSRLVSVTGKGRAAVAASIDAWRRAQAAVAAAIGPSGIGALKALSRTQLG